MTPLPPDMQRAIDAECRRALREMIWRGRLVLFGIWLCGVVSGAALMKVYLRG